MYDGQTEVFGIIEAGDTREKIFLKKRREVEKVYYTYRDDMFMAAFEVLHDEMLAEDAVSESFVRVIKLWDRLKFDNKLKTKRFLLVVCRNVAIDIYRKSKKVNEVLYEETESEIAIDNTIQTVISRESVEKIMSIIADLDPIYKDVLIMQKFCGVKRCEIARLFGITEETVTKRLQRAKTKIREEMRKEDI